MFQYEDVSVKEVSQAVAVQQFYGIVAGSLNSVRKFMERVPGVSSLTASDREAVLNAASLELLALRLAYRYLKCKIKSNTFRISTFLQVFMEKQRF